MQSRDYGPKAVYVTENGAAFPGVVGYEGNVLDPERQHYLETHVGAAGRAALEGVPLKGYLSGSSLTLRVELGLLEALRACARRLPDPEADTKGQFRLVPRLHRRSPCRQRRRAGSPRRPAGTPARAPRRRLAGSWSMRAVWGNLDQPRIRTGQMTRPRRAPGTPAGRLPLRPGENPGAPCGPPAGRTA
jgi:Glycosyl hydrolase family 1